MSIDLNNVYEQAAKKTTDAFANITEDGTYNGRLAAMLFTKQDEKYAADKDNPKELVTFVFDLLNEKGESVHVKTKACTLSFTDKSKLPKIWGIKTPEELKALTVNEDGSLKDLFVKCKVDVDVTEKGYFPVVDKVKQIVPATDQKPTKLTDWDKKVFGKVPYAESITADYNI